MPCDGRATNLGVQLDERLYWWSMVRDVIQVMRDKTNVLRSLGGTMWGTSQMLRLQMHQN